MKYYEKRHIFLAIAVVVAIFSLFVVIFLPQNIADTIHDHEFNWQVFLPNGTRYLYLAAFLIFSLAFLVIYMMDLKLKSFIIGLILLLVSIVPFYLGTQSYFILNSNHIKYSGPLTLEAQTYSWEDVEKFTHYRDQTNVQNDYEFTFNDEFTYFLEGNSYVYYIQDLIFDYIDQHEIEYEFIRLE